MFLKVFEEILEKTELMMKMFACGKGEVGKGKRTSTILYCWASKERCVSESPSTVERYWRMNCWWYEGKWTAAMLCTPRQISSCSRLWDLLTRASSNTRSRGCNM